MSPLAITPAMVQDLHKHVLFADFVWGCRLLQVIRNRTSTLFSPCPAFL
jgi:hypothetical protein